MNDSSSNNKTPYSLLDKSHGRGAAVFGFFLIGFSAVMVYGVNHPFPGDKGTFGPFGYVMAGVLLLMAYGSLKELFRFFGWSARLDEDALVLLRGKTEARRIPWSAIMSMRYRPVAISFAELSYMDLLDAEGKLLMTIPVPVSKRTKKWEKLALIKEIENRMPNSATRLPWPWVADVATKRPNVLLSKVFLAVGVLLGLPTIAAVMKVSQSMRDDTQVIRQLQPFANLNGVLLLGGVAAIGAILGTVGAVGLARSRWPEAFETRPGAKAHEYFEFMALHHGRPQPVSLESEKTYRYVAPQYHRSSVQAMNFGAMLIFGLLGLSCLMMIIVPPKATKPADIWAGWALIPIALGTVWFCEWCRRTSIALGKDLESEFSVTQSAVIVHRKDGTGLHCDLPKKWPKPKRSTNTFGSVLGRLRHGQEVVVVDPRFLVEVKKA